jgi:prepilin-type N-terminal cleavage/methylation domain-containing protein
LRNKTFHRHRGFTLIETLLALTILAGVLTATFATFRSAMSGWDAGKRVADNMQRARVVMDGLQETFRSVMFSQDRPELYEIIGINGQSNGYDRDIITFVTVSSRFKATGTTLPGPHRLTFAIIDDGSTDPYLGVAIHGFLENLNEDGELIFEPQGYEFAQLAPYVRGMNILFFDNQTGEWLEEWPPADLEEESTPLFPSAIDIELHIENIDPGAEDIVFPSIIRFPIAEYYEPTREGESEVPMEPEADEEIDSAPAGGGGGGGGTNIDGGGRGGRGGAQGGRGGGSSRFQGGRGGGNFNSGGRGGRGGGPSMPAGGPGGPPAPPQSGNRGGGGGGAAGGGFRR